MLSCTANLIQIDTTLSLLGFALTINASILTLAGAAFFYNPEATEDADLQGAYALIKSYIGNGAAVVFALALLCVSTACRTMTIWIDSFQAGQSASITATLAGQVISEGFINWKTNVSNLDSHQPGHKNLTDMVYSPPFDDSSLDSLESFPLVSLRLPLGHKVSIQCLSRLKSYFPSYCQRSFFLLYICVRNQTS